MFENIDFTNPTIQIATILVGIAVLLLGRKLFWLFVGTAGFVIGLSLAVQLLTDQPDWVVLVVALVVGLIGAVLAIFAQKIAIVIAGFVLGGYGLIWLLSLLSLSPERLDWLIFIIGGIIGAILVQSLFEAALIVLSALTGAALIVQVAKFSAPVTALLFIILLVVGIGVQVQMWREGGG